MNPGKPIIISPSDKIRSQLGLPSDQKPLSYYQILGVKSDSPIEELATARDRVISALDRLKYNPKHSDEVIECIRQVQFACKVLTDEHEKKAYDEFLKKYNEEMEENRRRDFMNAAQSISRKGSLSQRQKNGLSEYLKFWDIPEEAGQAILQSLRTHENDPEDILVAELPELIALVPRYQETRAFQILIKKNMPLLKNITNMKCHDCGKAMNIARLICECGSLLRGKLICFDCACVFPLSSPNCPECGRESKIMLRLHPEELEAVHGHITECREKGDTLRASVSCRDIMEAVPGDTFARESLSELQIQLSREADLLKARSLEKEGISFLENGHYTGAFSKLHSASKTITLCPEGIKAYMNASGRLAKKSKWLGTGFAILAVVCLFLGILTFFIRPIEVPESSSLWARTAYIFMTVCIALSIYSFINSGKFRKILQGREMPQIDSETATDKNRETE